MDERMEEGRAGSSVEDEPLPELFRAVYDTRGFVSRLAAYGLPGAAQWRSRLPSYTPLRDWWGATRSSRDVSVRALRRFVLGIAPRLADEVAFMKRWRPPPNPAPRTAFGELYENVAERYLACAEQVGFRRPSGPIADAGPEVAIEWDRAERKVTIRERSTAKPAYDLDELVFELPLLDPTNPHFDDYGLSYPEVWHLCALRGFLNAMVERTDPTIRVLEEAYARPTWEHVLDRIEQASQPKLATDAEWAFVLQTNQHDSTWLVAFVRRPKKDGSQGKWQRRDIVALYANDTSELERAIGRVAACFEDRRGGMHFYLDSPQGHELLRVLSAHPRVHAGLVWTDGDAKKQTPDNTKRARIAVGDLTMKVERAPNGVLSPRFYVGDVEVSHDMLRERDRHPKYPFRGAARDDFLMSAHVPAALDRWIRIAIKLHGALSFPPEAVGKVASATEALVREGIAELPREALGVELPFQPKLAVRVQWSHDGFVALRLFVSVHPGAPLVSPAHGATLFTYERNGRRVFVERDLAKEKALVDGAPKAFNLPLSWSFESAHAETIEESLAVAAWLDENPLGLDVELLVGGPPKTIGWDATNRAVRVREEGHWLVLDGTIQIEDVKLTLGEVLEAARKALRYVKADKGVFVELSQQALERLATLAAAVDLARENAKQPPRIHKGFAGVLVEAGAVLGSVRGIDLDALRERFATRDKRLRVGGLEKGKLRAYQREGVAWMLRLASWAPGCILADDMGLGKTVQTAAVLKSRASMGPQLVVAPASVTSNWLVELRRFVPSLDVRWLNQERSLEPSTLGENQVLVASYGLVQRLRDAFAAAHWATVVVDEAQFVKNSSAQRTDAVRALKRDFTIALTGTPLENHLGELYSIMDLVFPSLLGSEGMFRERFRKPIETSLDERRLEQLARLVDPFLMRRTRAEVLGELPPRQDIDEMLQLSLPERHRYLAMRKVCEEQLAETRENEFPNALPVEIFAAMTRLRQLACDPRLVDPTFTGPSTKVTRIVEIARELAQEGNRALVFSSFATFLGTIRDALVHAELRVALLTGETPLEKRRELVDAFQAGEYDIFCISLMAGGTGLNLTRASYVVHADPWWNPAVEEQATSRAHRMGQREPVTVLRLVARGTIEEAVLQMHAQKRELADAVLSGKGKPKKGLTTKDLLELLRHG